MDKAESQAMDLGKDNITRLFFKLFFPTLFGLLSMAAVTAINGAFVGHGIGSDGLGAVNITVPLWMGVFRSRSYVREPDAPSFPPRCLPVPNRRRQGFMLLSRSLSQH